MTTQLKRCLSLTEIVIYGVGLILGAGVYVLIGAAAGLAGNMLWLSFLLASIVAGFTAASYAELSALFPEAAAEYVYARKAFGRESLAWIFGFIAILIGFSTASAVAVGFAQYLSLFLPLNKTLLAAALIASMTALNYWGIKESARFNALATGISVAGLLLIICAGAYYIGTGQILLADLSELPPLAEGHSSVWFPVVSAGALIFFAFMGFEDIANIAEEARQPSHTLPRAFLYVLLICSVIYVLVAIIAISVVPYTELSASDQPLSRVMEVLIGGIAPQLIAVIALFATANTVLITLIVCARMSYGMAKSGSLPAFLAKVHPRQKTPYLGVCLVGVISIGFLFLGDIEVLASISDVGIFLLFLIVNLSNIALRFREADMRRPWRAPLNIGRLPVLSVLGALSCLLMLLTVQHPVEIGGRQFSSLLLGLMIFGLSIPLYYLFGRGGQQSQKD